MNSNSIYLQMKQAMVDDSIIKEEIINSLSKILNDEEAIIFVTYGFFNNGDILLILTNERVIFLEKSFKYSVIAMDMIDGVMYSKRGKMGKISIISGNKNITIKNIPKDDVRKVTEKIKDTSSIYKSKLLDNNHNLESFSNRIDYEIAQIRKYKNLLDDGLITQKEFEYKKKQIIGI